ncbi:MAG: ABC transporter ATP-binding protein [Frankia sp.]
MAKIFIDHVDKVYAGQVSAVDDLGLDIADGEFMVLVGPSGCGKTTALRMVAGLETITSGTISIGDRVVNQVPAKDRDIAMVFQNYALYPHMTVEDNISFGLELRRMPKPERQRRVAEAARTLGLEPFLSRRPSQLSGGQRQRVAMGRAIVREPKAFLMDEPLSNLDAKLRVSMRVSMRASLGQLQQRLGTTTIYVTHDQVEAMTLGHRVAVMHRGRLQQVDTPKTLFDEPANLFVATFIGSPPMNVANAQLTRADGPAVAFADRVLPLPEQVLGDRPGLEAYFGRPIILGIRPSDFEAAGFVPDGERPILRFSADLVEELGTEALVLVTLDAPPVRHEAVETAGAADEITLGEDKTRWTAHVNPRAGVHAGDSVELAVDTRALHFFDPETGRAIGRAVPGAKPAPAPAGAGGTTTGS